MVCVATLTLRGLSQRIEEPRARLTARPKAALLEFIEIVHVLTKSSHKYFHQRKGCYFEYFHGKSLARPWLCCNTSALLYVITVNAYYPHMVFTPKPRGIATNFPMISGGDVQNFIPWCKKQEETYKRAVRAYCSQELELYILATTPPWVPTRPCLVPSSTKWLLLCSSDLLGRLMNALLGRTSAGDIVEDSPGGAKTGCSTKFPHAILHAYARNSRARTLKCFISN